MLPSATKLFNYTLVGVLTLVVYLGAGAVLQRAGLTIGLLAPLTFLIAVIFNYLSQKLWVFTDLRPVTASLPKYVLMTCVGFILHSLTLVVLTPRMALVWAQSVAIILVVTSNAIFSFFWIFSAKRD